MPIKIQNKGVGSNHSNLWKLFNEEILLPAAILKEADITNNIRWMQQFAEHYKVKLAPHGKTTMAPWLFQRQMDAGAWGMTLATVPQVCSAANNCVSRVLMANQLVGGEPMRLIADKIKHHELEFYCLVDSVDNVKQLGEYFSEASVNLNLLIELGIEGGRCGCRTQEQFQRVLEAINQYDYLQLKGIEFYEGVIHGQNAEAEIRSFVSSAAKLAIELAPKGEEFILTGAGSAWYDLVAEEFSNAQLPENIVPLLRPGCYIIHDKGIYEEAQKNVVGRNQYACNTLEGLNSSLEIWAYILSIPEPGLAVVGMGKRDVAFDAGLPQPEKIVTRDKMGPDCIEPASLTGATTTAIMDQHSYVRFGEDLNLQVGDMIGFSTSHPCLTFDKWKKVCVTDGQYKVTSTIDTCF